jgi:hypothetical protein
MRLPWNKLRIDLIFCIFLLKMSLLYNLFIDSGILPDDLAFRQTEFLCEASSAIRSSLADSNPDIGSQLAVRLLVPYAVQRKDVEIVAAISNILDHYHPKSKEYAKTIISHVTPLIALKSVQTLESCSSVVLSWYRSSKARLDITQGISLLVEGIKLEAKVFPNANSGICFKILAAECQTNTLAILKSLSEMTPLSNMNVAFTANIFHCFEGESFDYSKISQALILEKVVKILDCYSQAGQQRVVGDCIIACLVQVSDSDGVQRCIAPVAVQWYLLRIACHLVKAYANEPLNSTDIVDNPYPFEKRGIGLLMERMLDLSYYKPVLSDCIKEMEACLAQGLSHAIMAENLRKQKRVKRVESTSLNIDSILSADLDQYDLSIQEQVVKRMLEL